MNAVISFLLAAKNPQAELKKNNNGGDNKYLRGFRTLPFFVEFRKFGEFGKKKFPSFAELFSVAEELINATVCGENAGGGDFVPCRFLWSFANLENSAKKVSFVRGTFFRCRGIN